MSEPKVQSDFSAIVNKYSHTQATISFFLERPLCTSLSIIFFKVPPPWGGAREVQGRIACGHCPHRALGRDYLDHACIQPPCLHLSSIQGACVSLGGSGPMHSFSDVCEKRLQTRYITQSGRYSLYSPATILSPFLCTAVRSQNAFDSGYNWLSHHQQS